MEDEWGVVAEAIKARMAHLVIDQATVARRSGLSDPFVRSMMNGTPRGEPRPTNLSKLCAGLSWSSESIDLIRQGKKPVLIKPPVDDPLVEALAREVRRLSAEVKKLRGDVNEHQTAIAALRSHQRVT